MSIKNELRKTILLFLRFSLQLFIEMMMIGFRGYYMLNIQKVVRYFKVFIQKRLSGMPTMELGIYVTNDCFVGFTPQTISGG